MIISTYVWFNKNTSVYHEVKTSITSNEVKISNLKRLSDNDTRSYNIKIENKENQQEKFKVYIIPDVLSTSISNNYIKYQVNDNNIKTLNMDGMIMISELEGLETKDINLKLWISDTYNGDLNYEGRVVVS